MNTNKTEHHLIFGRGQNMDKVTSDSVDLIVTSPPYPMIEMWDDILFNQNPKIKSAFSKGDYEHSFELMHQELDKVWNECFRVLKPGGIACINIGDATRTLDKNFRLFANHSRIIQGCINSGFQNMPNIIWRKQTNAPNKFMGSGMLPPGAYVTLEHEFILVFRKGEKRVFKTADEKENRNRSSYFWEERNQWFSDLWDIKGASQIIKDKALRNRSAAYPFEIPYRLINMFSVQGDVILDPFLGTGTSTIAAIASQRNSIGYEIDNTFKTLIKSTISDAKDYMISRSKKRIDDHLNFIKQRKKTKGKDAFKYANSNYNFEVLTRQEQGIRIPLLDQISFEDNLITASYID